MIAFGNFEKSKLVIISSNGSISQFTATNITSAFWSFDVFTKVISMDFSGIMPHLYFTVEDQSALFQLDMTSKEFKVIENIGNPRKIAVDWITQNVYVIDYNAEGSSIRMCNMAQHLCIKLITLKSTEHIKAIAVDPIAMRLFFSYGNDFEFKNVNTTVCSTHLDGTNAALLLDREHYVSTMTCDPIGARLYFIDMLTHSLWSVNYVGSDKRIVIKRNQHINRPIEINLLADSAIIMNEASNLIVECQLNGSKECYTRKPDTGAIDTGLVMDKVRQPIPEEHENVCAEMYCKTICVATKRGGKCICENGVGVQPNETCSFYYHLNEV